MHTDVHCGLKDHPKAENTTWLLDCCSIHSVPFHSILHFTTNLPFSGSVFLHWKILYSSLMPQVGYGWMLSPGYWNIRPLIGLVVLQRLKIQHYRLIAVLFILFRSIPFYILILSYFFWLSFSFHIEKTYMNSWCRGCITQIPTVKGWEWEMGGCHPLGNWILRPLSDLVVISS